MPEQLLTTLKFVFLALVWLFFLRVLRAVWAEISGPAPARALVSAPAAAPASAPSQGGGAAARRQGGPASGTLRVVAPAAAKGAQFTVDREATIGRGPECTITLDDRTVSQVHARLFHRDGRLHVEDVGSTNGTFLNAKRIAAPIALHQGDRVTVGETVLEVTK